MKNSITILCLLLLPLLSGGKNKLSIKKIDAVSLRCEAVPLLFEKNAIEYQSINRANWKEFQYKPDVSFGIAHTGNNIILHYIVCEASVRAIAEDNGRVWEDSCVEFFVSPEQNNVYYNYEANCVGSLLIQHGCLGEERPLARRKFLEEVKRWSSLGDKLFEERIGKVSWELVLIIPISAFFADDIDSFEGRTMTANFYKCGDGLDKQHFLSWNQIKTSTPSFHQPRFFGKIYFE